MKPAVARLLLALLCVGLLARASPVRAPGRKSPAARAAQERSPRGQARAPVADRAERVPPSLSAAQQAELISRQRSLAEEASTVVGHQVKLLEDEHFIFLSDLRAGSRRKVMDWLDALYRNLDRIFLVSKEEMRMWDGKLLVVVFRQRSDYAKFALKLEGPQAVLFAGGYFRPRQEPTTGAMTASVVVPVPEAGKRSLLRLRSVLVHECTHAFLYYWRRPGRTPLWLHEGTAVHMQVVADSKDPQVRALRRCARGLAESGEGYALALAVEGLMPQGSSDTNGYAQALAMTETLLAADTKRYVRFVRLMKEGTAQKEALKQAFGWSYERFDKNWREYARKEY